VTWNATPGGMFAYAYAVHTQRLEGNRLHREALAERALEYLLAVDGAGQVLYDALRLTLGREETVAADAAFDTPSRQLVDSTVEGRPDFCLRWHGKVELSVDLELKVGAHLTDAQARGAYLPDDEDATGNSFLVFVVPSYRVEAVKGLIQSKDPRIRIMGWQVLCCGAALACADDETKRAWTALGIFAEEIEHARLPGPLNCSSLVDEGAATIIARWWRAYWAMAKRPTSIKITDDVRVPQFEVKTKGSRRFNLIFAPHERAYSSPIWFYRREEKDNRWVNVSRDLTYTSWHEFLSDKASPVDGDDQGLPYLQLAVEKIPLLTGEAAQAGRLIWDACELVRRVAVGTEPKPAWSVDEGGFSLTHRGVSIFRVDFRIWAGSHLGGPFSVASKLVEVGRETSTAGLLSRITDEVESLLTKPDQACGGG